MNISYADTVTYETQGKESVVDNQGGVDFTRKIEHLGNGQYKITNEFQGSQVRKADIVFLVEASNYSMIESPSSKGRADFERIREDALALSQGLRAVENQDFKFGAILFKDDVEKFELSKDQTAFENFINSKNDLQNRINEIGFADIPATRAAVGMPLGTYLDLALDEGESLLDYDGRQKVLVTLTSAVPSYAHRPNPILASDSGTDSFEDYSLDSSTNKWQDKGEDYRMFSLGINVDFSDKDPKNIESWRYQSGDSYYNEYYKDLEPEDKYYYAYTSPNAEKIYHVKVLLSKTKSRYFPAPDGIMEQNIYFKAKELKANGIYLIASRYDVSGNTQMERAMNYLSSDTRYDKRWDSGRQDTDDKNRAQILTEIKAKAPIEKAVVGGSITEVVNSQFEIVGGVEVKGEKTNGADDENAAFAANITTSSVPKLDENKITIPNLTLGEGEKASFTYTVKLKEGYTDKLYPVAEGTTLRTKDGGEVLTFANHYAVKKVVSISRPHRPEPKPETKPEPTPTPTPEPTPTPTPEPPTSPVPTPIPESEPTPVPNPVPNNPRPAYPRNNVPDPNDPDSPSEITLIDENGVPLGNYVKKTNPDGTVQYVIVEETVPLANLPNTDGNGVYGYVVMGLSMIALGSLLIGKNTRKRKEND